MFSQYENVQRSLIVFSRPLYDIFRSRTSRQAATI